ncbi:hypothetical protein [Stenotrophomonas maltophilia]|uniref:hypothetical protein n=1 Tax=Stenotrophomonas maltophilia TaxID=40324 RepID=UPI0021C8A8B4|nr:hypothetical protein [Stenotrophomonas maltophilia]MCU1142299.1 hypothetical protein [Stenotrophomonas maltophilia]
MPVVNLTVLRNFMPAGELAAIRSCLTGEEAPYFHAKLIEFSERVRRMPKVYEQDGKGDSAIAHLRYFRGGNTWYITERDITPEQIQAFGMVVRHGQEPELSYINVAELIAAGAELDLHFSPTCLAQLEAVAA